MAKQHHNTASYPQQLREEAFDLFCTGLSRIQVQAELVRRHGSAAPSRSTLTRWAQADRWQPRRETIRQAVRQRRDNDRALLGPQYLEELQQLRHTVLDALRSLSFSTAESALFGLAALERVIERQIYRLQQDSIQAAIQPLLNAQLDSLKTRPEIPGQGSPGEELITTDETHEHNMSTS